MVDEEIPWVISPVGITDREVTPAVDRNSGHERISPCAGEIWGRAHNCGSDQDSPASLETLSTVSPKAYGLPSKIRKSGKEVRLASVQTM